MLRKTLICIVKSEKSSAGVSAIQTRKGRLGTFVGRVLAANLVLVFGLCVPLKGQQIGEAVYEKLSMNRRVNVIITLREPMMERGAHPARLKAIGEIQRDVLAGLTANDLTLTHHWKSISAIAGEITAQGLKHLVRISHKVS